MADKKKSGLLGVHTNSIAYAYPGDDFSGLERDMFPEEERNRYNKMFTLREKKKLIGYSDIVLLNALRVMKNSESGVNNEFMFVKTLADSILELNDKYYNHKLVQKLEYV